jgi:hypothetical protein
MIKFVTSKTSTQEKNLSSPNSKVLTLVASEDVFGLRGWGANSECVGEASHIERGHRHAGEIDSLDQLEHSRHVSLGVDDGIIEQMSIIGLASGTVGFNNNDVNISFMNQFASCRENLGMPSNYKQTRKNNYRTNKKHEDFSVSVTHSFAAGQTS